MSWQCRGPLPEPAFLDELPHFDMSESPAPTFQVWMAVALPCVLAYGADFEAQPDSDEKRRGWTIAQAAFAKDIADPPRPQYHWGQLALIARKAELLVPVGFAHAVRRRTNRSLVHTWRVTWALQFGGAK